MTSVTSLLCLLATTLLVRGAAPSGPQAARTELHLAIDRGDRAAWNRLLREGADVTARDADGNTPLHLATLHGSGDCVRALLDRGADANATNNVAATPLIYGITDPDIVQALLKQRADPNAKTALGMTPLLSAVSRGQSYEVVRLLVEAGADVHVTREVPWDGGALYRAIQGGDQRHVTDQVEDMEMPPLKKRKSYPALTPEQVQTLSTWINEGAEWPDGVSLEYK